VTAPAVLPVDPWPTDGTWRGLPTDVDPSVLDEATAAASGVLWALTGRRFGVRTHIERPCRREWCETQPWWRGRATWAWTYVDYRLAHTPVVDIVEVCLDGASLAVSGVAAVMRVDDWSWLVRTDGGTWPTTQDLSLPATEVGTWQITYRAGVAPPALASTAVDVLATELAKARIGASCDLPRRVTSMSRQGLSMSLLDPMDFLSKGRTGIYIVDLFISTYNPGGARRPARVFRADDPVYRRRTGT
jgi:hypothetical protein